MGPSSGSGVRFSRGGGVGGGVEEASEGVIGGVWGVVEGLVGEEEEVGEEAALVEGRPHFFGKAME